MLICPICDEDRYKDNEDVAKLFHEMRDEHRIAVCSTEWLTGQKLTGVGFKRLRDDAECVCFETVPSGYEGRQRGSLFPFQDLRREARHWC
ncbi:hypothetical protein AB1Y20_019396 [Prymnesium parvum]|uniref:Uncharacterized protein n=1 Tax=Prymnesium parvum TaxID=97485 RepID=A0AB34JUA0_PRYPA